MNTLSSQVQYVQLFSSNISVEKNTIVQSVLSHPVFNILIISFNLLFSIIGFKIHFLYDTLCFSGFSGLGGNTANTSLGLQGVGVAK